MTVMKTALLAAALVAAPALAAADGSNRMKIAGSCGEGQVYDAEKQAFITATS